MDGGTFEVEECDPQGAPLRENLTGAPWRDVFVEVFTVDHVLARKGRGVALPTPAVHD